MVQVFSIRFFGPQVLSLLPSMPHILRMTDSELKSLPSRLLANCQRQKCHVENVSDCLVVGNISFRVLSVALTCILSVFNDLFFFALRE